MKLFGTMFVILGLICLMGCGDSTLTGKSGDPIHLRLEIPSGEDPENFWFDVQRRLLRISRNGEIIEVSWTSGSTFEQDLNEGDQLTFEGFDSDGLLTIRGAVTVGSAKNLSIPVSKVL